MRRGFLSLAGFATAACLAAGAAEAAGNAASGQQVFARCAICHNAANGAGNKIGPDLFGVVATWRCLGVLRRPCFQMQ